MASLWSQISRDLTLPRSLLLCPNQYSVSFLPTPNPTWIFGEKGLSLFSKFPNPFLLFFFKGKHIHNSSRQSTIKNKIIHNSRTVTAENCAKVWVPSGHGICVTKWLLAHMSHLTGKEVREAMLRYRVGSAGPICSFVFHKLEHSSISWTPLKHVYR